MRNKAVAHAAELMQVSVDYLRKIGHPAAEQDAARVAGLHEKIGS
jgi:hypothetical protein